ncbi:hypothetical protein ACN47E_001040 [Coniothyrium glycines]
MPRSSKYSVAASPQKTPMKVPLNDDRQEKAKRRHALQEAQRNSFRASATPAKRRISLAAGQNSPHTPSHDQDVDMPDVAGTAVTPMKRVMPLLANFEEWMKMATDNKINANNSWNFALIDYFHEMSLLKEGDGVNFQKASCTLDGCVKIYTSRVDSVATDTGKLLSGLAENASKKKRGGDDDDEAGGDDDEGDEGEDGQKKRKRRAARSAEATLATSFAQLQNKKMELDFSVDPLFKKASADFDEGGAKGLLLNHLAIDGKGRIVFDSSDDANDATAEDARATPAPEEDANQPLPSDDIDIDLSGLAAKYFPDLARLDEQDVCPSMKQFDLGDVNGSMDLPFLKASEDLDEDKDDDDEEAGHRSGLFLDDENPMGFDDDDDVNMGGFDLPPETGFGEGGEIWAKEAIRDPQARVHTIGLGEGDDEVGEGVQGAQGENAQYGISMSHGRDQEQENILSYFDQALKKNWAGPEHWRIRRVKDAGKAAPPVTKRKEKEPFSIDFTAPMTQATADMLYTPATSNSTISLPKAQWISKSRNLLPDDKHFNSRQLLRLFLKPKARMGSRREVQRTQAQPNEPVNGDVDEAYWANREGHDAPAEEPAQGHYDADFYQDDGLPMPGGPNDDDDDFADARDHFSPAPQDAADMQPLYGPPSSQGDAYGAQLVTQSRRFRPEYVQYAKVAKKVDVKRLKDELWRGIGFEETAGPSALERREDFPDETPSKALDETLTFTDVVNNLQTVYPKQAMADISTSYCFICLLHLANEKGLIINNQENFENLSIRKDFTADLSVGGD